MNGSDGRQGHFSPGPDLVDLAAAFRSGADAPSAALERRLARIEAVNPVLNAFLDLRIDAARAEAAAADERWRKGAALSPIDGATFGVKANIAVAGLPWHGGIGAYRERVAASDADCVRILKEAGAVAIGILNMHEGALGATTDNPHFGRCRNPWSLELTPGGSSGGSAAAVGAGMCVFSLGTDTMGSVRIPSAYCSIVGHKPTFNAVPTAGLMELSPTLDHVGPHATSARACDVVLSVLRGGKIGVDFGVRRGRMRLGVGRWGGAVDCDDAIVEEFANATDALLSFADLVDIDLSDFAFGALRRQGLLISEVEGYAAHSAAMAESAKGFSKAFRDLMDWGREQSPEKVERAYAAVSSAGDEFRSRIANVDALVLPTAPQGPFAFSSPTPSNQADFTAIANFAGCPATAVPLTRPAGRRTPPPSVQFIARPGDDDVALSAAAAFERARDSA
ncbi:MAG: amidase [Alphaproteobacteria bacterium]|nr:amidase [Alphaproteobacteria bacterium]